LFLAIVKHLCGSGPLLLIKRPIQTAFLITPADVADGLWCQRNHAGDAGRRYTLGQLKKGQRAENHTHLLNSSAQQLSEFF
jgi:hypothetical protein